MELHESAEMYLETILVLTKKNPNVRSVDIASEMNFKKPSVSVAMKSLRENGYININGDGYIALTDKGMQIANTIYERHEFISKWLVCIGVDKEIASEDACRIEHVISPESFEAVKNYVANIEKK